VPKSYRFTLLCLGSLLPVAAAPRLCVARGPGSLAPVAAAVPESGLRNEAAGDAVSVEGLIRLDVSVIHEAGETVADLRRSDFKVLDDGQARKIVAFRGPRGLPDEPNSLTVILLLDTLGVPADVAAMERGEVSQFLRQGGGHLQDPVILYSLENSGLYLTATPASDGEALAAAVDSDAKVKALLLAPHTHTPFRAAVDASFVEFPALAGLKALGTIAAVEDREPGRKVLLWIGPGTCNRATDTYVPYGVGGTEYSYFGEDRDEVRRDFFQKIVWFSTLLRQARITLDCIVVGESEFATDEWDEFAAGVNNARQAKWEDLYRGVLALQMGGRLVSSPDGLMKQMKSFVEEARSYYTLTFEPPPAKHLDEYHSLKVEVGRPDLKVRTSTGYYDQPFYDDPPNPEIRQVTVAELEQIVAAEHGGGPAAQALSTLELTERLSRAKLAMLSRKLRRKELRASLEMIADESDFLDPPRSAMAADPPPDDAQQQRIVAAAMNYIEETAPKLPDFFARRTAIYYREVASYPEPDSVTKSQPLHAVEAEKATVLYRHGEEAVENAPELKSILPNRESSHEGQPIQTRGTFGPVLRSVQSLLKLPDTVQWSHWETSAEGRVAVFSYRHAGSSTVTLTGCCFPDNDEHGRMAILAGSHGEIAIDPASGAILRILVEDDLEGFVPTKQLDTVVSYGPVMIHGRSYIVPRYSVSRMRSRSVAMFPQGEIDFATWGPYETQMSVFTFDEYHRFRGNARVLPGFEPVP
jgi:VWFA-related protein